MDDDFKTAWRCLPNSKYHVQTDGDFPGMAIVHEDGETVTILPPDMVLALELERIATALERFYK